MRQSYSTVQVHNLPDFLVFCALLPKLQGVSVILDLHDLMPEFYTGRFGPSKRNLLRHLIYWQERLACRFADHVITVSEHWCQTLIKRGVPADKCSVVMNVADEAIFRPLKNYSRHRSCDNGQFRLIYHGTIVQRYGLDLAIRAIDLVKDEIPNIHLTILGRGDHVPELIKMTQELHLANYITIENKIRPAVELPEIIRSATLGIVPYRNDVFTDGLLPTKLMEYAALGLPAIAARTTAIQAYFSNTMVEFFEPDSEEDLAHCICRLYKSPDRLVELAKGSKKFNERNNWSQISRAYITLLERLSNR